MASTRKIKSKELKSFGEFTRTILEFIFNSAKDSQRIDLIFDSYTEKSPKDSERKRRSTVSPIELNILNKNTPLPVEMGRFWASSNNKLKLQLLIHQEALAMSIEKSMNGQLLVSNFTGMITGRVPCYSCNDKTCVEIPELVNDIEEADARIILHAMHAAKNGIDKLVILLLILMFL